MATITDWASIQRMIADNGETYCKPSIDPETGEIEEPGEEPVMRIVEYTSAFGSLCWGVVWFKEPVSPDKYLRETEYVRNPTIIWERKDLLERHPYK